MSANENVPAAAKVDTDLTMRKQLNRLCDVSALLASIATIAWAEGERHVGGDAEIDVDVYEQIRRMAEMAKERLEATAEAMDEFLTVNTAY